MAELDDFCARLLHVATFDNPADLAAHLRFGPHQLHPSLVDYEDFDGMLVDHLRLHGVKVDSEGRITR